MSETGASDLVVLGGGIIGLATAWRYSEANPGRRVVVLEKERQVAQHQTGRNSGVLHSGIYYKPGTLRARNCVAGRTAMVEFCQRHGIAHDVCGKVIVAVDESEVPALDRIFERGQANGVRCERIDGNRLRELEPHCAGVQAIHVPEAGIVDYPAVCLKLVELIEQSGGKIVTSAKVTGIKQDALSVCLQTTAGEFAGKQAVNCAGLFSDRVTALGGQKPDVRIVPFRGEYYVLKPEARRLVRNLIYPVPDARFPFLGLHFTRMTDGSIECGPNAVPAFAREGYLKHNFNLRDMWDAATYPGFLRLALKHWRMGAGEIWRSLSKQAFVRGLQRLVPEIRGADLDSGPAGVRAQALERSGALADDFVLRANGRILNVCNAPSPAATAALNIGTLICRELAMLTR